MRQASKRIPDSAEKTVRDIRRATRRHHSAEARPFSNEGKTSNGQPSNNDAACISRQSQPETSNQMSQPLS